MPNVIPTSLGAVRDVAEQIVSVFLTTTILAELAIHFSARRFECRSSDEPFSHDQSSRAVAVVRIPRHDGPWATSPPNVLAQQ